MVSKVVGDQVIEWLFWGFSLLLIFQRCGFETIDQLSCSRVAVLLLQIKRDDDSLAITCDYCTRSVPAVTLLNAGKPTLEKTQACMLVTLLDHSAVTAVVLKRAPVNNTSGDARLNCASSVLESKRILTLDTRVQSLNIPPATEPSYHAL